MPPQPVDNAAVITLATLLLALVGCAPGATQAWGGLAPGATGGLPASARRPRGALFAAMLAAAFLALAGCAPAPEADAPDFLPAARGPYRRVTPVARYTSSNLYEYIDGQAPYVVSYGFVGLATADYRRADEPVTTVDVYDMGSVRSAFALFRSNANLESSPLDIGTEGAGGEGRIEFWQDRYYVVVSSPAAEDDTPVRDIARAVADDLPPTGRMPDCLAWLPAEGRIEASLTFTPTAYLGYEVLQHAAAARFRLGETEGAGGAKEAAGGKPPPEVTLFACRYASPDAAVEALAALRTQLAGQSAPMSLEEAELADLAAEGVVADKFVMGRLVVFRQGRFLAGMLPWPDHPAARPCLAALAAHVKGRQQP